MFKKPKEPARNLTGRVSLGRGYSLMDWLRLAGSGKDLSGTGGKYKDVTYEELKKHNKEEDCWMAVHGVVFNITPYIRYHPGGVEEIMRGAGADGTKLFDQNHAWVNASNMLKACIVGRLAYSPSSQTLSIPALATPNANIQHKSLANISYTWKDATDAVIVKISNLPDDMTSRNMVAHLKDNHILFIYLFQEPDVCILELALYCLIDSFKISELMNSISLKLIKRDPQSWKTLGNDLRNGFDLIAMSNFDRPVFPCRLVAKTKVTHDSDQYICALPKNLHLAPPVGHHLFISVESEDLVLHRSYTPIPILDKFSSSSFNNHLVFMIKVYREGIVSSAISQKSIGDVLDISPMGGNLTSRKYLNAINILLIAAGTGITPMLGILDDVLFKNFLDIRQIKLIFFNKTEKDILYRKQLEEFQEQKKEYFNIFHVLSSPDDSWSGLSGRISLPLIKKISGSIFCEEDDFIAICGPQGFNKLASEIFTELTGQSSSFTLFQG